MWAATMPTQTPCNLVAAAIQLHLQMAKTFICQCETPFRLLAAVHLSGPPCCCSGRGRLEKRFVLLSAA